MNMLQRKIFVSNFRWFILRESEHVANKAEIGYTLKKKVIFGILNEHFERLNFNVSVFYRPCSLMYMIFITSSLEIFEFNFVLIRIYMIISVWFAYMFYYITSAIQTLALFICFNQYPVFFYVHLGFEERWKMQDPWLPRGPLS